MSAEALFQNSRMFGYRKSVGKGREIVWHGGNKGGGRRPVLLASTGFQTVFVFVQ